MYFYSVLAFVDAFVSIVCLKRLLLWNSTGKIWDGLNLQVTFDAFLMFFKTLAIDLCEEYCFL